MPDLKSWKRSADQFEFLSTKFMGKKALNDSGKLGKKSFINTLYITQTIGVLSIHVSLHALILDFKQISQEMSVDTPNFK